MRIGKIIISICLILSFAISCGVQESNSFSKARQVAEKNGELIVCDYSLLNGTITLPLSTFAEELQMVKLDNAVMALVKESTVEMSENYIMVNKSGQVPYKLFDKKTGKYITDIGAFGQGPGEYQNTYDQQLDEENNRIYLLPWSTNVILVYDLKGNFIESIPLCFNAPKGKFQVDSKAGTVIVSVLPFGNTPAVVWQQTIKGELLKSIAPDHLSVVPDFSNEMEAYKTGGRYGFSIFTFFELRADSVYHYDVDENKLLPVFTMNFNSIEIPIHYYVEANKYFMGSISEPKKLDGNTTTQNQRYYFVDKETLKGSFFTLENDYLGGIKIEWPIYHLSGDYFVYNVEPANLREELEAVLSNNNKMTPEMRSKLSELKNSISENENNYIFYAKFK